MHNDEDIIVTIEMGGRYEASPRLTAAISELVDAITADHGDDVEGFHGARSPWSAGGVSIGWSPSTGVLVGDEVLCELRTRPGSAGGILPTGETHMS